MTVILPDFIINAHLILSNVCLGLFVVMNGIIILDQYCIDTLAASDSRFASDLDAGILY